MKLYEKYINNDGDIKIVNKQFDSLLELELPNILKSNISIINCNLLSLKGSPEIVEGYFHCNHNKLKSLEYSPQIIKDSFDCSNNELTALTNSPKNVASYICNDNKLESLIGLEQIKKDGYLSFSGNNLISLEGIPNTFNGKLVIINNINLKSFDYIPNILYELKCFNTGISFEDLIEYVSKASIINRIDTNYKFNFTKFNKLSQKERIEMLFKEFID